jgi:hypothetical protein
VASSILKELVIASQTSGGRSVGIVRWRTHTMEFMTFLTGTILIEKIATQYVTTIKWIFISFNIK